MPGSKEQYARMVQALKGRKRYISDNAKEYSRNLRGSDTAVKQRTFQGTRVNWVMILARGRMYVDIMPEDWRCNGAGMAVVVDRSIGMLPHTSSIFMYPLTSAVASPPP